MPELISTATTSVNRDKGQHTMHHGFKIYLSCKKPVVSLQLF